MDWGSILFDLPQIIVPHLKLELPVYSMAVSPQEQEAYTSMNYVVGLDSYLPCWITGELKCYEINPGM